MSNLKTVRDAVIDWSKAPEGATHYYPKVDCFYSFDEDGNGFLFNGEKEECGEIECFEDCLIPRPIQSTVYTQEMNDNGILPSVGMEFLDGGSNTDEVRICLFIDGDAVVYKMGVHYPSAVLYECKPLTPPVELIDGKAYQFDHHSGKGVHGIYIADEGSFKGGWFAMCTSTCTNIKPLTVEIK